MTVKQFTDDLIPVHTDNLMQQIELYKTKEIRVSAGRLWVKVDKCDVGALLATVTAHPQDYKAWMTPNNRIFYVRYLEPKLPPPPPKIETVGKCFGE